MHHGSVLTEQAGPAGSRPVCVVLPHVHGDQRNAGAPSGRAGKAWGREGSEWPGAWQPAWDPAGFVQTFNDCVRHSLSHTHTHPDPRQQESISSTRTATVSASGAALPLAHSRCSVNICQVLEGARKPGSGSALLPGATVASHSVPLHMRSSSVTWAGDPGHPMWGP